MRLALAVLLAATPIDPTWRVADASSLGIALPDATGAPPARRIDRDRIAAEQEQQRAREAAAARNTVWDRLAECESGGDWHINTGNGYSGGVQFAASTWRAMGGGEFAAYAYQATREEQIIMAERLLKVQGWSAWPACSRKLGLR